MRDVDRKATESNDYECGLGALRIGPGEAIRMTLAGINAHQLGVPRRPVVSDHEMREAVLKQMEEEQLKKNGG